MTSLGVLSGAGVVTMLAVAALAASPALAQGPSVSSQPMSSSGSLSGVLPLEGTTWRLLEFRSGDQMRMAGPAVAAWMTLRDGGLRGSGGCNRVSGRYARMGEAITVELDEVDRATCPEQTMLVERGLIEGLGRAAGVEVVPSDDPLASELIIRDPFGSERLRFGVDDAAALDVGEWQLDAYSVDGEIFDADREQPAVLAFQPSRDRAVRRRSSGDVVGSSGCNGLVGRYVRDADVLRIRDLERTDAPCPVALQAQEDAMLAVLEASTMTVTLPPDRLVLTSGDSGDRLELLASAPLEGSTWLLARIPGSPPPETDVTLRLVDGEVLGEGPCGPYSGRYETNGIFIAFLGVTGSRDSDCPVRGRETDLLAALRSAVLIDRSRPRLRFLDARGQAVARFRRPAGP